MSEQIEIEITPEMIEAGRDELSCALSDLSPYEPGGRQNDRFVSRIFRAMEAARPVGR